MKISIPQFRYPSDYDETLTVMNEFLSAPGKCAVGTDLLVLPEYSNCPGMPIVDVEAMFSHCRKYNSYFLASLKKSAEEKEIAICANLLYEKENGFSNTTFLINKKGRVIAEYDKTHLAYNEIEILKLIPGTTPVFTELEGVKITFAVCFELYFPEYFETLAAGSPDIILAPSYQRSEDSAILIKQASGRALDTGAYMIRTSYSMGADSKTGGSSYIISPYGEVILNAGQDEGIFNSDIIPKRKRMRPLAHGLGEMSSRNIVEKFRIPELYRKDTGFIPPDTKKFPRVCAHRGFSGLIPENTLPAFASALSVGASEIEFDVRLTSDNQLIISHDGTVDRVSDSSGNVSDFTFNEIRALNAGEYMGWQSIKFPTPEEVFQLLGGKIIMNIHVYQAGENGYVITELKRLIDKYGIRDTVYFAAGENEMKWCLELAPSIERCMLECFDEKRDIVDIALTYKCSRVQHFYRVYSSEIVKKAVENHLISNLFYEDIPEKVESRLSDGIDVILTNYPDRILPLV